MHHRHIITQEWTIMALESLMERGELADWREFVQALKGNELLALRALRVSDTIEDRASAALARVLILGRYPQFATSEPGKGSGTFVRR